MSFIIMGDDLSEPISLKLGMNEIKTGNSVYKFEVKEFPTNIVGMCYAIIPMGISITVCLWSGRIQKKFLIFLKYSQLVDDSIAKILGNTL